MKRTFGLDVQKPSPILHSQMALIDEAAVWQRALSDNEIKQAMTGNFPRCFTKRQGCNDLGGYEKKGSRSLNGHLRNQNPLIKEHKMKTIRLFVFAILNVLILDVSCLPRFRNSTHNRQNSVHLFTRWQLRGLYDESGR